MAQEETKTRLVAGSQRDATAITDIRLPVFYGAPSRPVNRVVHHAREHGRPIACGVAVYPGDYGVGDGDGGVIVPATVASKIAQKAADQKLMEAAEARRLRCAVGRHVPAGRRDNCRV